MKVKNLFSILVCQVFLFLGCSSDEMINTGAKEGIVPASATLAADWVQLACGDESGNVFVYGMEPTVCSADVHLNGKTLQISNLRGEVIIGPFYARVSNAAEWWRIDEVDLGGMDIVNCRITFDPTKNQSDYLMGNPYKGSVMKFYINIQQGMTRSFKMKLHYAQTPELSDEFTIWIN